jgi:hypothetical protein
MSPVAPAAMRFNDSRSGAVMLIGNLNWYVICVNIAQWALT